ncbi:adenine phosphoribosyltransferase [Phlebopus sp. FC_14]|nr:adenine phosphoribosyltransferase [Phlebopus sp. FC_14]
MADVKYLQTFIKSYAHFPKKGINFLDIFPILRNPLAFETLITHFVHHITSTRSNPDAKIDVVVGLDARGFLLGPIVALRLGAAFVPVRKKGKLPGQCIACQFDKEYGKDAFEMQEDAIQQGQNVIIIDDLIATGGSAKAAGELVKKRGAKIIECLFIIELVGIRQDWDNESMPIYSIIQVNEDTEKDTETK